MALSIQLKLTRKSKRMLKKFPEEFKTGFYKGLREAMWFAEKKAKESFGSTGKPKSRTGHLRRSIQGRVKKDGNRDLIGVLGSNVEYAALQEVGGRVVPRSSEYLRFQIMGNWVRLKEVIIPARPFLRPAITDNIQRIENIISEKILKEVK